ncbi:MAG: hypothetical protein M1819_006390 [Sarea resinae]|nr:MAG: hypothetical protein M1819_006390 [Sarea resinae]
MRSCPDTTSQGTDSPLDTSAATSPLSAESQDDLKKEPGLGPTETMVQVEEEMRKEGEKIEQERLRLAQKSWEAEAGSQGQEKAVNDKLRKLNYLLNQSEVYVNILASKMREQREVEAAKSNKERGRAIKREEAAEKAAESSQRRVTRAAATTGSGATNNNVPKESKTKQTLPRGKGKKQAGVMNLSDLFSKDDKLEAKAGDVPVSEALEVAAQEETQSSAIGAHDLRPARQPDLMIGGTMRGYQLEGLEWLKNLYENGLNGILADEMGLGKTIQTISFIAFLRSMKVNGPFLIAAPMTTLDNWVQEFEKWTPTITAIAYIGLPAEREALRTKYFGNWSSDQFPVICTSYEICMNDQKYLAKLGWKFIIIDEAHRLKNFNCRLIRVLKTFESGNRLLITGTPLQNNLAELWSLLNFLMPQIFDSLESFEDWFDFSAIQEKEGSKALLAEQTKTKLVQKIHAILKPFLLRRVKTDVEASLPKKREYILYAPLTNAQKELYGEILSGNSRSYLEGKAVESLSNNNTGMLQHTNSVVQKRKAGSGTSTPIKSAKSSRDCTPASGLRGTRSKKRQSYREVGDTEFFKNCDKPDDEVPINEEEQEEIDRAKTIAAAKKQIANKKLQNPIMQLRLTCNSPHNFYWPWSESENPDRTLITESGKMLILERLVPELIEKGHKILIFSQFKTQLDILDDWAQILHDWPISRIDGAVKRGDRTKAVSAFNTESKVKLFLLSTRAGGQGINLTAADTVIIFDSDWNPQQDLQAQDRAHRIGQTRPVIVYRLATKGTVEQTLLEKADGKRRLEKLVIQKGQFRSLTGQANEESTSAELQRLLLTDDFEKFDLPNADGGELLSQRDLDILTDRSEAAYLRAEKGEDTGEAFKTVETKNEGTDGVLAA